MVPEKEPCYTFEEAMEIIGTGRTQWVLLLISGLTFGSDAAELTFLIYVTEGLRCEWGLTPDQESMINSAVFVGMLIGGPVWGYIADAFGRRVAFLLSSAIITVCGFLTAAAQGFISLMLVRSLVGFGVAGVTVAFDVLAESLTIDKRGHFLMYIELFWTLGSLYVTFCAWGVLSVFGWRFFTVLVAIPTLVSIMAAYLFLSESPLWLVEVGRTKEAVAVINRWAVTNGSNTRFNELRVQHSEHLGLRDLCKHRKLCGPTFLMALIYFAFGVTYYGVVMMLPRLFEEKETSHSGTCEPSFDFGDLTVAAGAEMLGVVLAVLVIDRLGRVWTQSIFYFLTAVALLVLGFGRSGNMTILLVVASVGRMAIMASTCASWVQTPEIVPTSMRAEVHSMLNVVGKVGSCFAPFIISEDISPQMSGTILSATALGATVAALLLPETANQDLGHVSESDHSDSDGSDDDAQDSDLSH